MDMPHIWPAEDRYIAHLVSGGEAERFTQQARLRSAMFTSGRFLAPLHKKLFKNRDERYAENMKNYGRRRAIGATHFFDEGTQQLIPYETTE